MDREYERQVEGRVLRAGDVVKIKGLRGDFKIKWFRGRIVTVTGGPRGQWRNVYVERIGVRRRRLPEE